MYRRVKPDKDLISKQYSCRLCIVLEIKYYKSMDLTFNWFKQKQKDCYGKKNYTFNKCALCTANITCSTRASKLVNFVNEYLITTMDGYLKGYTYINQQLSSRHIWSIQVTPHQANLHSKYSTKQEELT